MFLPIGDTPNPERFVPWVNWLLIAVNVLVYVLISLPLSFQMADPQDPMLGAYVDMLAHRGLAQEQLRLAVNQISAYDLFIFEHGFTPARPTMSTLLSAMFMHAGFAHLAGNMLFLWIYGDNVEHRMGRIGYLVTYLVCGALSTVAFTLVAMGSKVPLVGASGAISGVLGLYFLFFPKNLIKVFVLFFPFVMDTFLVPSRIVLGIYLVVDNLLPFFIGSQSGVAYGAHIGGFVGGLAIALMVGRRGAPADRKNPQVIALRQAARQRGNEQAQALLELARVRLDQGEPVLAYQLLVEALERSPDPALEAEVRRELARFVR